MKISGRGSQITIYSVAYDITAESSDVLKPIFSINVVFIEMRQVQSGSVTCAGGHNLAELQTVYKMEILFLGDNANLILMKLYLISD